jgi:uncharacterized membrane protein
MTDTAQPKPAKSGRGLRIALAVSVALNLAVLAAVGGAVLREGHGMRSAMVRDLGFGPYAEALRPEDRKALRDALFARAPEIRENRRQMRADTQTLLGLLRADPLDAEALRALMGSQHSRMTGQLKLGQDLLQDFLVALPPDERRAFADRLEEGLRHHGEHEDKKGE